MSIQYPLAKTRLAKKNIPKKGLFLSIHLAKLGVKEASIASNAEPNISNFLYESLNPVNTKRGFEFKKKLDKDS